MTGTSKETVAKAWKDRSNELLRAFRARDLTGIDVLSVYLAGVFLGHERCVVVALAIDVDGHKHLLDFEEGSSESAEVVHGLLAKITARGLVVGRDRRVLVLRDGSAAIAKAVGEFWPDAVQQECVAARKLLFTVGAHEGLKCGSESGRKGVGLIGVSCGTGGIGSSFSCCFLVQ